MIALNIVSSGLLNNLLLITGLILSSVFVYIKLISIKEKEYRAARVAFLFSIVILCPFLLLYFSDFEQKELISIILLGLVYGFGLLIFLPIRRKVVGYNQDPVGKHDERDIMFSRNELIPGTEQFEKYY